VARGDDVQAELEAERERERRTSIRVSPEQYPVT
jgi:hypothetical protein